MPRNAVGVADSGWDIPEVGVVAVGGLGTAILDKLTGRLPYLGRSIAIDTDVNSLNRIKADHKLLLGDGKSQYLKPHSTRLAAQSSIHEIADALAWEGDCAFGFGSASGVDGAAAATREAIDVIWIKQLLLPFGINTTCGTCTPISCDSGSLPLSIQILLSFAWRLTIESFCDGHLCTLTYSSNFYCLPGKAGGSPI